MSRLVDNSYHLWMISKVVDGDVTDCGYLKVLKALDKFEFTAVHPRDEQRINDAITMRENYSHDIYGDPYVVRENTPVTVLELMIALCERCENEIMDNRRCGNRTGLWFWVMVGSLGLTRYLDSSFDNREVTDILDRFVAREYDDDGSGGLITIDGSKDMPSIDIWSQVMRLLNTVI